MQPTIGRIVHYRLSAQDADEIATRRALVVTQDGHERGNSVYEGLACSAVVVAVSTPEIVNLQVLLDGDGSHWATSRHEGDEPGTWSWPARV
jgi:hypothetical protein